MAFCISVADIGEIFELMGENGTGQGSEDKEGKTGEHVAGLGEAKRERETSEGLRAYPITSYYTRQYGKRNVMRPGKKNMIKMY